MATLRFTDADRDEHGRIKPYAEPRSLADLLPSHGAIHADAAPTRTTRAELVTLAAVWLCAVLVLFYVWTVPSTPVAPPQAPPTPLATVQATSIPTSPPARVVARYNAYAAPDGALLGQVEADRQITPVAHSGDDWVQALVADSGLVWLRAADWPELAITGPDLAPKRPAAAPVVRPIAQPTDPPPPPCASAGVPGKMVEVCDYTDLASLEARAKQQWIAEYGGNLGIVTTPTPPDWSRP
jgi:hypothetical protein